MPSSRQTPEDDASEEGRVVAGHGRHVVVEAASGAHVICHSRGKKNACVVGDRVRWQRSGDEGIVVAILPRKSLLFRQDAWRTKAFAANLDQLLVVVAATPVFSESQLARALIAAHEAGIDSRIVANKRDLPAFADARARLAPYAAMAIDVVEVALKADPDDARDRLVPLVTDRVSLVLGPSGAGKSTLVNLLAPGAAAAVGEISIALAAGRHTTTATRWHPLGRAIGAGAIIDSPGFQQFGLFQIAPNTLASHMPDLAVHASDCRFYNCLHVDEPGCGVTAAVARGEIGASRLRIYREIQGELLEWQKLALNAGASRKSISR